MLDFASINIRLSAQLVSQVDEAAIAGAVAPQDIVSQAIREYLNPELRDNVPSQSDVRNDDFEFIYGKVEDIDQALKNVIDSLHCAVTQDNAMCVSSKRRLLDAIGQLHGASQNNISIAQITFLR